MNSLILFSIFFKVLFADTNPTIENNNLKKFYMEDGTKGSSVCLSLKDKINQHKISAKEFYLEKFRNLPTKPSEQQIENINKDIESIYQRQIMKVLLFDKFLNHHLSIMGRYMFNGIRLVSELLKNKNKNDKDFAKHIESLTTSINEEIKKLENDMSSVGLKYVSQDFKIYDVTNRLQRQHQQIDTSKIKKYILRISFLRDNVDLRMANRKDFKYEILNISDETSKFIIAIDNFVETVNVYIDFVFSKIAIAMISDYVIGINLMIKDTEYYNELVRNKKIDKLCSYVDEEFKDENINEYISYIFDILGEWKKEKVVVNSQVIE